MHTSLDTRPPLHARTHAHTQQESADLHSPQPESLLCSVLAQDLTPASLPVSPYCPSHPFPSPYFRSSGFHLASSPIWYFHPPFPAWPASITTWDFVPQALESASGFLAPRGPQACRAHPMRSSSPCSKVGLIRAIWSSASGWRAEPLGPGLTDPCSSSVSQGLNSEVSLGLQVPLGPQGSQAVHGPASAQRISHPTCRVRSEAGEVLSALQGKMWRGGGGGGLGRLCSEVMGELGPADDQVPSRELWVPEELGEGMWCGLNEARDWGWRAVGSTYSGGSQDPGVWVSLCLLLEGPRLGIQWSWWWIPDSSVSCFLLSCRLIIHPRPSWSPGSPRP